MFKQVKTTIIVIIALLCCSSYAADEETRKIKVDCGPYTINMDQSGLIHSIFLNKKLLLKRGTFFINLKDFRDAQTNAYTQGARTVVKEDDGKKIISTRGSLKEKGNNLEYAQQITLAAKGEIDVKLKIKYLLKVPYHMQYELYLVNPDFMHGKKATATASNGIKNVNTIPADNFPATELIRSYFKQIKRLFKFAIETDDGTLTFEFINIRGRAFLEKNGKINWIMTPLSKPLPDTVVDFHYKILFTPNDSKTDLTSTKEKGNQK